MINRKFYKTTLLYSLRRIAKIKRVIFLEIVRKLHIDKLAMLLAKLTKKVG